MKKNSTKNIDAYPLDAVPSVLVMCLVCAAGLGCTVCALLSPGLEWRILSIAAPAAAVSCFTVEVRSRWGKNAIRLSLNHCLLFAGVIALGPLGASLPAALGAFIQFIGDNCLKKPLPDIFYEVAKSAAVCSLSSFAYVLAGGNIIQPQRVDSFIPFLCAAAIYISAHSFLAAFRPKPGEHNQGYTQNALSIAAGWSVCIFSGYALAVLYATAPSYVLLALAAPAVLVGAALFAPSKQHCQPKETIHEAPDSKSQSDDKASKSGSAFVDPETGLANKRYLDMFLKNELSRSERAERPLSVAVFDLDEFKSNHSKKDTAAREALVAMGEKLKSEVRDYDLIATYSSTRLVTVFPEASAQEAEDIAWRLHDSVVSVKLKDKPLSVSVGISTFPENGSTPEDLINASHRALNQGRFIGPNRVHSFRELQKAS